MTQSDPEKEIRAGEEEREWQDKSSREQQGRGGRGNDGDCFNLKVISVSLNALLIFLLGFVWRLPETWLGSLLWQQADTVHRLWSCYPLIMSTYSFSGHRLKRSHKVGAQTGGETQHATESFLFSLIKLWSALCYPLRNTSVIFKWTSEQWENSFSLFCIKLVYIRTRSSCAFCTKMLKYDCEPV